MARVHAPEIEDEPWCPAILRDGLTGFLRVAAEVCAVYDGALDVVEDLARRHGGATPTLVDLCSGGGGPVLRFRERLAAGGLAVQAILTDLYPNRSAFAAAEAASDGQVRGHLDAVDAADVPADLVGVRTLFNGLHHFRPEDARRLLADAVDKRAPIVVVELVERRPLTLLTICGTPLLALLVAPLQRPSLGQLLMTYLVPIIPLAILWDGLMSCLRAYSRPELEALTAGLTDASSSSSSSGSGPGAGYTFRVVRRPVRFLPARLTVLIGEPTAR